MNGWVGDMGGINEVLEGVRGDFWGGGMRRKRRRRRIGFGATKLVRERGRVGGALRIWRWCWLEREGRRVVFLAEDDGGGGGVGFGIGIVIAIAWGGH